MFVFLPSVSFSFALLWRFFLTCEPTTSKRKRTSHNSSTTNKKQTNRMEASERNEEDTKLRRPLAIVFDIDGTLIRESRHLSGFCIRPHVVELLVWCLKRQHRVALWTASHWTWADSATKKLCPLVQKALRGKEHECVGRECKATFEFMWGGEKMKRERPLKDVEVDRRIKSGDRRCAWCEFYSEDCDKCDCKAGPNECPCRDTKDLRGLLRDGTEAYQQKRTLLVENTPQMCRYTYGNTIYVPTYRGRFDDNVFSALQAYFADKLDDDVVNVTRVVKCEHPPGPHACYCQSWWPK